MVLRRLFSRIRTTTTKSVLKRSRMRSTTLTGSASIQAMSIPLQPTATSLAPASRARGNDLENQAHHLAKDHLLSTVEERMRSFCSKGAAIDTTRHSRGAREILLQPRRSDRHDASQSRSARDPSTAKAQRSTRRVTVEDSMRSFYSQGAAIDTMPTATRCRPPPQHRRHSTSCDALRPAFPLRQAAGRFISARCTVKISL